MMESWGGREFVYMEVSEEEISCCVFFFVVVFLTERHSSWFTSKSCSVVSSLPVCGFLLPNQDVNLSRFVCLFVCLFDCLFVRWGRFSAAAGPAELMKEQQEPDLIFICFGALCWIALSYLYRCWHPIGWLTKRKHPLTPTVHDRDVTVYVPVLTFLWIIIIIYLSGCFLLPLKFKLILHLKEDLSETSKDVHTHWKPVCYNWTFTKPTKHTWTPDEETNNNMI